MISSFSLIRCCFRLQLVDLVNWLNWASLKLGEVCLETLDIPSQVESQNLHSSELYRVNVKKWSLKLYFWTWTGLKNKWL
jgi:hypothetical protein